MEREPVKGDIVSTPIGKGEFIAFLKNRPEGLVKFRTKKGFHCCSFGKDSIHLWSENVVTIPEKAD
jgi:hypothetical protein